MAQCKAGDVDTWLRRPDPSVRVVLVYGPDRGLVSERAATFAKSLGLPLDDPFSVIRLDAPSLESDPARLLDEAYTVPLFGGTRLLWLRNAGAHKGVADAVRALCIQPPPDAVALVEAGDLKKGAGLRAAVEQAPAAMALPCYVDEGRGLEQLIDSMVGATSMTMDGDARQLLRSALGGDRLASRGEIEKLLLYCEGQGRITVDDVVASVGDVSAISADQVVDSLLAGRIQELDDRSRRLMSSGSAPFVLLSAAMRQMHQLTALRAEMEANGRSAGAVVGTARPPIFFSRRGLVEAALARWSTDMLARILERLQDAVLATRRRPELATEIVRHCLLAIATTARRT